MSLTDSTGNVVDSYSYDPWGQTVQKTGTLYNPFTYRGYYQDEESGFYYLVNRYYDPQDGRFLSEDPDGAADESLYTYVNNDPVNAVDPEGNISPGLLYGVAKTIITKGIKLAQFVYSKAAAGVKKLFGKGTGNLNSLLKSKSLGRGSTGRTTANSLQEQLAMKEVLSNPLKGATRVPTKNMNDPRWLGSEGWVKMQKVVKTSKGNINIHFNYNTKTGKFDDFKFK
ncbi:RHS repeat-associated core domain-containing protein [Aneurinibacillus sp. Ricciae_BoGa-3]|uniref:RHS repeat-associated core domain-containing protein n=1 Tax=Aneurinibacillus sp. Ricciae_BoGa-3 TaxID=3022697 RepID=UPI003FA45848